MTPTEFFWLLFLNSWQINVLFVISMVAVSALLLKALK